MYNIKNTKRYELLMVLPSFSTRYEELIRSNKKNILYVKEVFDPSTFRYRAYNVEEAMKTSEKYQIHYFLTEEIKNLYSQINKINMVVFQRAQWTIELNNFIKILKKYHIKIIFDVDDLIYKPKYVSSYLNSISDNSEYKLNSLLAISERLDMVAKECDSFITTTSFLKKSLEKDYHKKALVLPNFLNESQEEIAKEILKKKKDHYDKSKFIIGYFSGSNSHKRDLETIEEDLIKMMKKHSDVYLKIVGLMDLTEPLKLWQKKGRIIIDDFVPYEELAYKIASVDVNIIPLQNNSFNACKSELKYFEASLVETPTCASNNDVYRTIIKNQEDGFLCNEKDWYHTLETIYQNQEDMIKVGKKAYQKCKKLYSSKKQREKIEVIYDELFQEK